MDKKSKVISGLKKPHTQSSTSFTKPTNTREIMKELISEKNYICKPISGLKHSCKLIIGFNL